MAHHIPMETIHTSRSVCKIKVNEPLNKRARTHAHTLDDFLTIGVPSQNVK